MMQTLVLTGETSDARRLRPPLTIAAAQPPCVAHDVAQNAVAHAEAVRAADARVVVFPELSLTGYELDAAPITADDDRLAPIVEACDETGAVALVGAPLSSGDGRRYIAMLCVDGTGASVAYRKRFVHGDEVQRFAAGECPAVQEVDGWRLGLAICKDTGVAQHAADTAALGIDVYVAGIVHAAEDGTLHEERARNVAAAHGVWVAVASFAGPTGAGFSETVGRSGIWAPDCSLIAQAGAEPGDCARATLRDA